jgi:hypothetical protein
MQRKLKRLTCRGGGEINLTRTEFVDPSFRRNENATPGYMKGEKYFEKLRNNEKTNISHAIKRKANRIGHTLRSNWLLKETTEGTTKGNIEVKKRRGRRRNQLLDAPKKTRKYSKLKEEVLDSALWRTRSEKGSGPVLRQTTW